MYYSGELFESDNTDFVEEYIGLSINDIRKYVDEHTNDYTGELEAYNLPVGIVYPVFLNIKQPVIFDANGLQMITFLENNKEVIDRICNCE